MQVTEPKERKKTGPEKWVKVNYRQANELTEHDLTTLYDSVKIGMTVEKAAKLLQVKPDTIHNHFQHVLDQAHAARDRELLNTMWNVATAKNNVTMLIWLSKQYLGFTDKTQTETMNANFDIIIGEPDTKPANEGRATSEDPETASGSMAVLE